MKGPRYRPVWPVLAGLLLGSWAVVLLALYLLFLALGIL